MSRAKNPDLSPVFILGNPRSGTTLLRLMLTAHSNIGISPECEFIVKLFPQFGHRNSFRAHDVDKFLVSIGGRVLNIGEMWEVPLEDLIPDSEALVGLSYPEVCARVYRGYQRAKGLRPGLYWGDKNNAFGNYIDVLTHMYPTARFIHIVRDGRAVLNSYNKLKVDPSQKYAPRLPKDPFQVGFSWSDMVDRIDRHLDLFAKERSLTVRYEDILDQPEREMHLVCRFLGVEYEASMLDYYKINKQHSLEPKSYTWKENTQSPLQVERKTNWMGQLPEKDVRIFEAVALPVMERHGYTPLSGEIVRVDTSYLRTLRMKARVREILRRIRMRSVTWRSRIFS